MVVIKAQDCLINKNGLATVFIAAQLIIPRRVLLEKSTAHTALVNEYFSYKQAHPRRLSIVLKWFYHHEPNRVPECQYSPTCFLCLLQISNLL